MDGMSDPASISWLNLVQKLSLCGRQVRKALAELALPRGLTDTDALLLWACQQAGAAGHPQHDLVPLIGVSPAQLSGLLEALGTRGWLIGRRPSTDRRRQYWRITPEGAALLSLLLSDLASWSHAPHLKLSTSERRQLAEQLHDLAHAISHSPDITRATTSQREAA